MSVSPIGHELHAHVVYGPRPGCLPWNQGLDFGPRMPRDANLTYRLMQLPSFSNWRSLVLCLVLPMAAISVVQAQPTGGPYGPIEQRYEVPTEGRVYYVAPAGNPEAAGTTLDAPTTLEALVPHLVTDDVVILRGGIYRTGNLELNQGITLQPYEDEKPILKGTEIATDWETAGDGVWRTSWTRLFPSEPLPWWQRGREEARTPLHRFNNDMVFVDGRFLQSAGSVEELDENNYYIDYDAQAVYIGQDPAGHTVEITTHDNAIFRTTADVHGKVNDKKGFTIRGITFTQYAWAAIVIEGRVRFTHLDEPVDDPEGPADPATYGKEVVGTTLENVTISFCSRVGGYFRGDGLVIRNSLFSDTSTEGIYIIGSSNVLLERNVVLRNDIERITGYYVSAVKIIDQTHNVVVRDNLVMDHPTSNGVWYDVGNRNGVFINNYVEGTGVGFFFEISRGVIAAGNVFVNNGLGSWMLNSADGHVYNNTYVNSPARFSRDGRSAQGDHFNWHPATGPGVDEREGHIFMNNLLVTSNPGAGPLLQVDQPPYLCDRLTEPALTAIDGNVYVRQTSEYASEAAPVIRWTDTTAENCSVSYASLDAFHDAVSGFEEHGHVLEGTERTIFNAPEIRRYELRKAIPSDPKVVMPESVRELLGWSKEDAAQTVGAYPVD